MFLALGESVPFWHEAVPIWADAMPSWHEIGAGVEILNILHATWKQRLRGDAMQIQTRAEGKIMTLAEAADFLNTSYSTVYRLVTEGALDAFRLRNNWRTSTKACEDFVRRQFAQQAVASRPHGMR